MKVKKLFLLLITLLGVCNVSLYSQGVPVADLLDIKFQSGGTAVDVSAKSFSVNGGVSKVTTEYDAELKQYVSKFSGDDTQFYRVDYKGDEDFKNKVKDAYTIEVYTKVTSGDPIVPFGAMQSGGFGIYQDQASAPMELYHRNGGDTWTLVGSKGIYDAINPEYYHIVFTYDGTTVKAYYNGEIESEAVLPTPGLILPPDEAAHWMAIGGDASLGDYITEQYYGDIALVRLYSKAISAGEVSGLYNQIQDRKAITSFDDLNTLLVDLSKYIRVVKDTDKKVKAEGYNVEGWELMNSLSTGAQEITNFITEVKRDLDDLEIIDDSGNYPIFGAISDIHVGRSGWEAKVDKALTSLVNNSPKLDAIFITGDITDWGTRPQFEATRDKIAEKVPSDIPVYYCMGNHDWLADWHNNDKVYKDVLKQDLNQYIVIKDYPFIMISMEWYTSSMGGDQPERAYTDVARNFLREKLALASKDFPGKPIFVFQHIPNYNTVYGSYEIEPGAGDNWGTDLLQEVLKDYPQVICISGHTHNPLGDERSIHQEYFTSINDGNVAYSELEYNFTDGSIAHRSEDILEGCIISLDAQNDVTVRRMNFFQNVDIQKPWVVAAPHDGTNFAYKNRSGEPAPSFDPADVVTISRPRETILEVEYPQAKDNDAVNRYVIEIADMDMNILESPSYQVFSLFYLNAETPNPMKYNMDISKVPSGDYYVRIIAVDAFGNKSAPLLSEKFTVEDFIPDPTVEAPVANLLDVKFRPEGKAHDASEVKFDVAKGPGNAPTTIYDNEIKQYISKFSGATTKDGDTDIFYMVDYDANQDFRDKLKNAFTLEVYTKTKSPNNMNPVGSAQAGGFCIEQAGNGGFTEFWIGRESGGYAQVGSVSTYNKDNPEYYHIVFAYDGDEVRAFYNGESSGSALVGSYRESTIQNAHWLGIGGDATEGHDLAGLPFIGDIGIVRMYDKALSRDEIHALYKQLTTRKDVDLFNDLNDLIINTLPAYVPKDDTEKVKVETLIKEGWDLMDSSFTTEQDIIDFKKKAEIYVGSDDTSIRSLKINGEDWNVDDLYVITCDMGSELQIEIETTNSEAISDKGKSFVVSAGHPTAGSKIDFIITAANGKKSTTYSIPYSRATFDFNSIVIQKWNSTLIVNNNPSTNNGFSFASYKWMENGMPMGTGQTYINRSGLDQTTIYSLELETTKGQVYNVCPTTLPNKSISMHVSPNPVTKGELIRVKAEFPEKLLKEATLDIYSITGSIVLKSKLAGEETFIQAPSASGIYVIRVLADGISKEFKLLVK